jgi:hypothetical protein
MSLNANQRDHYSCRVTRSLEVAAKFAYPNTIEKWAGIAVSIATRYWLDSSGVESRCGARFSAPVQTRSGAHLATYIMDTGSFPGVKRPGHGDDHPLPSSAKVKEKVELYLYSTCGPSWPVIGWTLPLPVPDYSYGKKDCDHVERQYNSTRKYQPSILLRNVFIG